MIADEFDIAHIASVNFGVRLRTDGNSYFVPTDVAVREALGTMVVATFQSFEAIEGEWEPHDVSEDYGERRRVFAPRGGELMADLAAIFDADDLPDLANLDERVRDLDYYFAVCRDDEGRKLVAVRKATQFKGTLAAQNRFIRLVDDSFVLIEDKVLKLDTEFDVLISDQHIFMLRMRAVEQIGQFVENVASAARAKLQVIHDTVPFLDMSRIQEKIDRHPKLARLACSIAGRADLAVLDRTKVERDARDHGVRFKEVDGRLLCNVTDEAKLLEVLDARRYHSDLTINPAVPYRATGRQRVT